MRRTRPSHPVEAAASLGERAWRVFTSVRFAIVQLITLAIAGVIGTLLRQIPSGAIHNPALYASEIADLHRRYDGIELLGLRAGPTLVAVGEQLGLFRIFSAPWFALLLSVLTISIVCGTLNRLPRLWREVRRVQIVQADGFYDQLLAHRAEFVPLAIRADEVVGALRRKHFRVQQRELSSEAGAVAGVHLYGGRNQYTKLSTLLTHASVVLFLIGALISATAGFETIVFVGNGATAPVQPVGTPHNLLIRNVAFAAPLLPSGKFADFYTDLEVYQDGALLARKTIRVNDPLEVAGFTFHQNTFGPSARLTVRGPGQQLLWTGPVVLAGALLGRPQGYLAVPGSNVGLLVLLDQSSSAGATVVIEGIGPPGADGAPTVAFIVPLRTGEASQPIDTLGYTITFDGPDQWSGISVKNDPGEGLIWLAFATLTAGLVFAFYFPRRRVWLHFAEGRVRLAMLADRYVDIDREFDELLRAIVPVEGAGAARRT